MRQTKPPATLVPILRASEMQLCTAKRAERSHQGDRKCAERSHRRWLYRFHGPQTAGGRSERTQSGLWKCAERTHRGQWKCAERTHRGQWKCAERTHRGPRKRAERSHRRWLYRFHGPQTARGTQRTNPPRSVEMRRTKPPRAVKMQRITLTPVKGVRRNNLAVAGCSAEQQPAHILRNEPILVQDCWGGDAMAGWENPSYDAVGTLAAESRSGGLFGRSVINCGTGKTGKVGRDSLRSLVRMRPGSRWPVSSRD